MMMTDSILLVDDDQDMRTLLSILLKRAGYLVYQAVDGLDALHVLRTTQPSVCISDVMMPGMSGLELCQRLRSDARTTAMPIILLSARSDCASIEQGLQSGADLYLAKPVSMDSLSRHIRELIDG
jgi:two-component system, OmpR family, phosphate regulon response regulator PhoB